TLTIERRWIVDGEEHVEQVPVRHDAGIVLDPNDLGMSRGAGTDLFVRRVRARASRIPALDAVHALELEEHRLETPEAAAGERRAFGLRGHFAAPPNSWRKSPYPSATSFAFGTKRSDAELMQ